MTSRPKKKNNNLPTNPLLAYPEGIITQHFKDRFIMTQTGRITEETKRIGLELKLLRVRAGLSQEELCNLSNGELRRGTVIAIEKAKYNASIGQICTYAGLLGYRINVEPDPDFSPNNQ